MDSFLKQKTIHANGILGLLENAKMSKKGHKSTRQPFFMQGESSDFKAGHDTLPEIPDALNRHFKLLYGKNMLPRIKRIILKEMLRKDMDPITINVNAKIKVRDVHVAEV